MAARTQSPEITTKAGVEGHLLQNLAKIQQYVTVWRCADPCSLQCLLTQQLFAEGNCCRDACKDFDGPMQWDSGFCQETRQTNQPTPGYLHYLYPPAESDTPEMIFTTRGNHKQTSGIPLLLARNFQWGTSYKATLLMLLL